MFLLKKQVLIAFSSMLLNNGFAHQLYLARGLLKTLLMAPKAMVFKISLHERVVIIHRGFFAKNEEAF